MHYYLYEIRNNINGKIYIGVHRTFNMDDGYMGSGKILCRAIAKYGVENFTKTILETFTDATTMFVREKEIVNEEFLSRSDVYNLRRGGSGGFDYINKNQLADYAAAGRKGQEEFVRMSIEKYGDNFRSIISSTPTARAYRRIAGRISREKEAGLHSPKNKDSGWKAALHPNAAIKRKDTLAKIGHQQAEKNSQYGTMWITNDAENKKINKNEIIPVGWRKGRIIVKHVN
jgi:hypothetical protein